MVTINRIYTRTGDDGTTGLIGGERVPKDSARVAVFGDIDELNSFLGVARTIADKSFPEIATQLATIQNELFDIGAALATPPDRKIPQKEGQSVKIIDTQIARLEGWIDGCGEQLQELTSFVLPGGSPLNGALHVARAVCRRAERAVIGFSRSSPVDPDIIRYLNRLSDLLFAQARLAAVYEGGREYLWEPGKKESR